jgi:hypothetical protein
MNADIKRRKKKKKKKRDEMRGEKKRGGYGRDEAPGSWAAADAAVAVWERNRNATECGPPVLYRHIDGYTLVIRVNNVYIHT